MSYVLLILFSKVTARICARPLQDISYTDNNLVLYGMENMLFILLSASMLVAYGMDISDIHKILSMIFLFCLCCIIFTDAHAGYIYDRFNILIFITGLTLFLLNPSFDDLKLRIIGSLAGAGFLMLINAMSLVFFKKEGIGGGDIKLCLAAGFVLGYPALVPVFALTFLPAAIYCLLTETYKTIALGPFICISAAAIYCLNMT